jgi:curved DNA-binding protein
LIDYYEFLQISPNADTETIHRVYRFLAGRFHPDNPASGDADLFHLLKTAYDVLTDPDRRDEYDAIRKPDPLTEPLSSSVDFMDNLDGELNRRLALLAVLYHRRRTRPDMPEVPLDEIETRMGFPRDYLDFTVWYLVKKGYVTRGDSALFALTAEGVDFVEKERGNIPVLNKLLTSGTASPGGEAPPAAYVKPIPQAVRTPRQTRSQPIPAGAGKAPIILPAGTNVIEEDGWIAFKDRRANKVDRRAQEVDRRASPDERRKNPRGRRSTD